MTLDPHDARITDAIMKMVELYGNCRYTAGVAKERGEPKVRAMLEEDAAAQFEKIRTAVGEQVSK